MQHKSQEMLPRVLHPKLNNLVTVKVAMITKSLYCGLVVTTFVYTFGFKLAPKKQCCDGSAVQ